ncbi:Dehydrodolichyl diphosphate synthase complex subunit NUS1 [Bienertia sinuspersici]
MDFKESRLLFYSIRKVARFVAILLWNILHYLVAVWYWVNNVVQMLESYLISSGFIKKYKSLDPSKLRYLAIVVESEEAHQISEVIELLNWLVVIGVKHVCLYDMEGFTGDNLAKCNARPWKVLFKKAKFLQEVNGVEKAGAFLIPSPMTLEFISSSDAKEGVVKAANMLFLKYKDLNEDKPKFTESLVDEGLQLVGCSGPEPDLLLIYGPARCHLGFPAWRLSYTEIV